jgi:hypothetical protein
VEESGEVACEVWEGRLVIALMLVLVYCISRGSGGGEAGRKGGKNTENIRTVQG